MSRRRVSARTGSAIRFAVTITVVDLLAVKIFPAQGVPMFASMAVVAALYFLDFDGSWRERLGGYAIATAVGLVGLVVGVLVTNPLWLAVVAAFAIAFGFGLARVLRGYVARSAIGVQLAFLLCLLTPATPGEFDSYLAAWALGSLASVVAALTIFPLHHTGQVRRAIAAWCREASVLPAALGTNAAAEVTRELEQARDDLLDQAAGTVVRPGLVSRRMRALQRMRGQIEQATRTMGSFSAASTPDIAQGVALAQASHDAFLTAASAVEVGDGPVDLADMDRARREDEESSVEWTAAQLHSGGGAAVDALVRHNGERVLSISADVMQNLAARSCGEKLAGAELGLDVLTSVRQQLKDNLTLKSIWLRNAVRTGIAVSGAVLIARLLGLEHGFWVVVTSLSLVQVTFTAGASSRSAVRTSFGVVAGVVVSGALMWVLPQAWMSIALLPVLAFFAKWATAGGPLLGQFAYTPFAVVNLAVLSWPQPIGVIGVRIEDVVIGVAVGLVATWIVLPRGQLGLISAAREDAQEQGKAAVAESLALIAAPRPDRVGAHAQHLAFAHAVNRFCDAVDAAYMNQAHRSTQLHQLSADEARFFELLLVTSVFDRFSRFSDPPSRIPRLAEALKVGGDGHVAAVRQIAEAQTQACIEHPRALVTAVWAAWWLDHIARSELDNAVAQAV
jgi:uncharacterized membrane protein YccC